MIDAFTNVFGTEHHKFIRNTLNNLDYIFFVPISDDIEMYLCNPKGVRKHDIYLLKKYLNYIVAMDNKSKTIFIDYGDFMIKHFIPRFPFSKYKLFDFWDAFEDGYPCLFYYEKDDGYNVGRVILLPIFIINLRTIYA